MNILETMKSKPEFSTLSTAITAAGLEDALSAAGPLTVFAPNNDAFAKLPEGELDGLLKPDNKAKLTDLLKRHVVSGKHMESEFKGKTTDVATLGGAKVKIEDKDGKIRIDGSRIRAADMAASNGVIHAVGTVVSTANAPAA